MTPVQKVCLINPPTTNPGVDSCYFPLSLITLAGVCKEMGVPVDLWDFDLYFKTAGNVKIRKFRKLLRHGIDGARTHVFGISSICANLPMALWIAKEIKEHSPDSFIGLGGPQPSTTPKTILERFPFVDLIVVGEGETTLKEIVQADWRPELLLNIPGLALRVDGKIKLNPKRELVENMDELPIPNYDIVDFKRYRALQPGNYLANVEAGRGCPFHCVFCSTATMWEKKFRMKTPERIFREMSMLHHRFGVTAFDLNHDNFTASRKSLTDFCDYMEEHNDQCFEWYCSSRVDCVDVPLLEKMHRAGLRGLFLGIETGSKRMQKIIQKNLDVDAIEPLIEGARKVGVNTEAAFIFGFPEEERADLDDTVHKALRCKALGTSRVILMKLAALTGTELYRRCVDQLKTIPFVSTISPNVYAMPYIDNLVAQNSDLFSSFYHVPHPLFSAEYLTSFREFVALLLEGETKLALSLIENLELGATQLFEKWDDWAKKRHLSYCHSYGPSDSPISLAEFQDVFRLFLKEEIYDR